MLSALGAEPQVIGSDAYWVGPRAGAAAWTDAGLEAWSADRWWRVDAVGGVRAGPEGGRPLARLGDDRVEADGERGAVWVGVTRFAVEGQVFGAALLPDRRGVVLVHSASGDPVGGAVVVGAPDGSSRRLATLGGDPPISVAVGGDRVAVGTLGGALWVWTLDGGEVFHREAHARNTWAVAVLPGGGVVSGGDDDRAVVWSPTGEPGVVVERHGGRVSAVVPSPDGSRVATLGPRTLQVWDLATGRSPGAVRPEGCDPTSAAWSPDGRRLATTCAAGDLRVVDVATGEASDAWRGPVVDLAFSADGGELLIGREDRMDVVDARTGAAVTSVEGHRGPVAITVDGDEVVTTSNGPTIRVSATDWTASEPAFRPVPRSLDPFVDPHARRAWEAVGDTLDGVPLAIDQDRVLLGRGPVLVVWSIASRRELARHEGHRGDVTVARFGPGGVVASGSADGTVRLWR